MVHFDVPVLAQQAPTGALAMALAMRSPAHQSNNGPKRMLHATSGPSSGLVPQQLQQAYVNNQQSSKCNKIAIVGAFAYPNVRGGRGEV